MFLVPPTWREKLIAWLVIAIGVLLVVVVVYRLITIALDWPSDPSWWAELPGHERDQIIILFVILASYLRPRTACQTCLDRERGLLRELRNERRNDASR